jgi:hypothetical protein
MHDNAPLPPYMYLYVRYCTFILAPPYASRLEFCDLINMIWALPSL